MERLTFVKQGFKNQYDIHYVCMVDDGKQIFDVRSSSFFNEVYPIYSSPTPHQNLQNISIHYHPLYNVLCHYIIHSSNRRVEGSDNRIFRRVIRVSQPFSPPITNNKIFSVMQPNIFFKNRNNKMVSFPLLRVGLFTKHTKGYQPGFFYDGLSPPIIYDNMNGIILPHKVDTINVMFGCYPGCMFLKNLYKVGVIYN